MCVFFSCYWWMQWSHGAGQRLGIFSMTINYTVTNRILPFGAQPGCAWRWISTNLVSRNSERPAPRLSSACFTNTVALKESVLIYPGEKVKYESHYPHKRQVLIVNTWHVCSCQLSLVCAYRLLSKRVHTINTTEASVPICCEWFPVPLNPLLWVNSCKIPHHGKSLSNFKCLHT